MRAFLLMNIDLGCFVYWPARAWLNTINSTSKTVKKTMKILFRIDVYKLVYLKSLKVTSPSEF